MVSQNHNTRHTEFLWYFYPYLPMPWSLSLRFVLKGPVDNIPALVLIMVWRQPGNKQLSEPMTVSLLTHMWVTRSQWVKGMDVLMIKLVSPVGFCAYNMHKPLSNKKSTSHVAQMKMFAFFTDSHQTGTYSYAWIKRGDTWMHSILTACFTINSFTVWFILIMINNTGRP